MYGEDVANVCSVRGVSTREFTRLREAPAERQDRWLRARCLTGRARLAERYAERFSIHQGNGRETRPIYRDSIFRPLLFLLDCWDTKRRLVFGGIKVGSHYPSPRLFLFFLCFS